MSPATSYTLLDPLVIGLLLLAAIMHASWNAILKSERSDRLATFGVMMLAGGVLALPVVPFLPMVAPPAWKWLVASMLIHLAYYYFLLRAYALGDLSHIYPIARGSGPLLVALLSGQLLGEALRLQDVVGVAILTCGLIALARPAGGFLSAAARGGTHARATMFAALTGVTIAGYILADGLGVRSAGPTPEHRIAYIAWLNILEAPWLILFAYALRKQALHSYLRQTWWKGAIGGSIATLGYGIAIYSLSLGPMAHVAALRETSVLFGALLGTLLLGESFGRTRVAAAFVIALGLVMMNGPRLL